MAQPAIVRLLIDSALEPDLRRRLAEAPDGVFEEYALTAEERELLRRPDHRLLPLLGAAVQAAQPGARPSAAPLELPAPPASTSTLLPDCLLALTVVPCLVGERIAFAAWIAPLQEGADPSRLPPPIGAELPGQPLTPLHAVIQLSAAQTTDAGGPPQVSMWASFKVSSNALAPPPPETAGNPDASPFGSALDSPEVEAAAAAVRAAAPGERYQKLAALTRVLRGGDVR